MSLCASQLVDASETAVQTSDVSGMLVHVSGVSDSGVHFRVAETLMPEEVAIEIALCCILFVNTATLDTAVTVTGSLTVTLVLTVIELWALAANAPIAYRSAAMLMIELLAAVKPPIAYLIALIAQVDAAETFNDVL